jgi:hypothetical protein
MIRDDIITLFLEKKILGKNLKSNKHAEERLTPELLDLLIQTTGYLSDHASVYERLLNLRLGITEEPKCENCNNGLTGRIYFSQRRYHRFCNEDCRHEFVTEKRVHALLSNDSALAKQIAKKSLVTQRSRGTLESRIKLSLKTKRDKGICIPEDAVPAYMLYKSKVYAITNRQPLNSLENIEKRGPIEKDGWHIDHRYSIHQGFQNNISPEIIGHIANLELIPGKLNVSKQDKCSIDIEQLILEIHQYNLQN